MSKRRTVVVWLPDSRLLTSSVSLTLPAFTRRTRTLAAPVPSASSLSMSHIARGLQNTFASTPCP